MKRLFFISFVFFSCNPDKGKLIGSWQAVAYYEMGQSIATQLDSVRITFSPSGDYTFKSIGYYEESGQYRLSGKYLFLRDTSAKNPEEHALKLEFLSADSLKIGMEFNGKKQTVFFLKHSI
jgi:hypothetical protein